MGIGRVIRLGVSLVLELGVWVSMGFGLGKGEG